MIRTLAALALLASACSPGSVHLEGAPADEVVGDTAEELDTAVDEELLDTAADTAADTAVDEEPVEAHYTVFCDNGGDGAYMARFSLRLEEGEELGEAVVWTYYDPAWLEFLEANGIYSSSSSYTDAIGVDEEGYVVVYCGFASYDGYVGFYTASHELIVVR